MWTTFRRSTLAALVLAVSAATVACESLTRPTADLAVAPEAIGAAASSPALVPIAQRSPVNLGQCLGGTNARCFDARPARTATVAVSPATAPGAPTSLTYTVSGSTVFLQWNASVGGDPVASYRLQAGSAPGLSNYADFLTLNTATSYTAFDVFAGTYYVRIVAQSQATINQPAAVSGPSNEAVITVGGSSGGCPTAPRTLVNASQSAGAISLTWTAPASGTATSYVIVAGSAPGLADLANFDTGSTALSYLATGVPAGSFYVRVYAKSSCGLSSASNEVLVFVIAFGGEVQVSVSWDAPADVDLHVIDPSGEEVYYGNRTSLSGGQLDVDSNPGCSIDGRQIENITWASRAPAGTYTVRVDYWSDCGVARTNYLVTVKNGGSTQTFSGNFTGLGDHTGSGGGRTITTFTHAAFLTLDSVLNLIRPPDLFVPSAEKLALTKPAR